MDAERPPGSDPAHPWPAGRPEQVFASSTRTTGWFGLVVSALFLAIVASDVAEHGLGAGNAAFGAGFLLLAAVVTAVNLRPALRVHPEHLVVRNALSDTAVPWRCVEDVQVRQVLELDLGVRRVPALALGRTLRQQRRHHRRTGAVHGTVPEQAYEGIDPVDFTAMQVRDLALERGGGRDGDLVGDEGVTTRWRVAEVVAVAVLAALTAVLAVLALA